MFLRATLLCCLLLLPCAAVPAWAQATPAVARNLPSRGMSMRQVRNRYGAPLRQLQARGGHAPRQPVIHRWVYPGYIVYFERSRVIHSVATTSGDGISAPSD